MRKKPSAVRSPVMNGPVALIDIAGEQLRRLGVGPAQQHGRHAFHVRGEARGVQGADVLAIGTSTLPPRWPHFFSDASWSSKCTPAAPASIIARISS